MLATQQMPPSEGTPLQKEIWRVEDRVNQRIDAHEAKVESRHRENVARLEHLEKVINQGLGAAVAVKYLGHVITAALSAAAGYILHLLTNR